jgi:uncharacterized membrane protein
MDSFLDDRVAHLIILTAVCAALIAVGVYAVAKVRGGLADTKSDASDLVTKFREIHGEGDLTDEEFRTIKTLLAGRLDQESKRTDEED